MLAKEHLDKTYKSWSRWEIEIIKDIHVAPSKIKMKGVKTEKTEKVRLAYKFIGDVSETSPSEKVNVQSII